MFQARGAWKCSKADSSAVHDRFSLVFANESSMRHKARLSLGIIHALPDGECHIVAHDREIWSRVQGAVPAYKDRLAKANRDTGNQTALFMT
eukprot:1148120-Pelagomonas_calceolata.AAC.1